MNWPTASWASRAIVRKMRYFSQLFRLLFLSGLNRLIRMKKVSSKIGLKIHSEFQKLMISIIKITPNKIIKYIVSIIIIENNIIFISV